MMALFLVLQTWRNTQQEDNCRKIIEVANGLYEKFVGLYSTCETLGNQLTTVNTTYKKVLTQLHDGTGNIVGRVERLIELGVPSTKRIQRKSNRLTSNEVEE
jgi:DNA recombination protein RmuC